MGANWFTNITNMFFTWIDRAVYSLISIFYQLFLYLANLDLFGMSTLDDATSIPNAANNIIVNFSSRIYALLGIFMLFKVSFSILQYMVNPDDFSDKSKGFGKMITNILTSLVLIVAVPFIFQFAFKVQKVVLSENLLGSLILGESNSDTKDMKTTEEMAEDLQFLVYGSFFSVDTSVSPLNDDDTHVCANNPVLGTKTMAKDEKCLDYLTTLFEKDGIGIDKLGEFFPVVFSGSETRRFDAFGEIVNVTTDDGKYAFKYMPIISTVAGGFVVVMLLSFCMDAAVRVIKLGFLEIISPIPIISYMDPKQSGKDGMLGRWAKECFSTFISLFIRIAIIYFVFFMTDIIANNILANPSDQLYLYVDPPEGLMAVFVQVMVILGLFFFAKEVPKLLENLIPGMSGAGSLTINPLKKINESPLAAGALALGGAAIGGAAANAIAAGKKAYDNREDITDHLRSLASDPKKGRLARFGSMAKYIGGGIAGGALSTAAGAVSAGARGAYSAGKNKNMLGGISAGKAQAVDARNDRAQMKKMGLTPGERFQDMLFGFAGVKNKSGGIGALSQEQKEITNRIYDAQKNVEAAREAQASWVQNNSTYSMTEFKKAAFNPKLDKDGNEITTPEGTVIYDESVTRSYSDYMASLAPGETPISKKEFDDFCKNQNDIIHAQNELHYFEKELKDLQDVMDINDKKRKK